MIGQFTALAKSAGSEPCGPSTSGGLWRHLPALSSGIELCRAFIGDTSRDSSSCHVSSDEALPKNSLGKVLRCGACHGCCMVDELESAGTLHPVASPTTRSRQRSRTGGESRDREEARAGGEEVEEVETREEGHTSSPEDCPRCWRQPWR